MLSRRSLLCAFNLRSSVLQYFAEDLFKVLVACKSDMESEREVSDEEGVLLAARHGMPFFATSALRNTGVTEVSRGLEACNVSSHSYRLLTRRSSTALSHLHYFGLPVPCTAIDYSATGYFPHLVVLLAC